MNSPLFETGDYVWVGTPSPVKTTWLITGIHKTDDGFAATLKSGNFGREWIVPIERLALHSRAGVPAERIWLAEEAA